MSQKARSERARKAAEDREAQQRRESIRRRLNIGAVVIVVLLIVGVAVVVGRIGGTSGTAADVSAPAAGSTDYGVTIGSADAPHQVVIYEDFLCPFCGELEAQTGTQLSALADEGKVYVDYRPFQLFTDIDFSAQELNTFKVVLDAAGAEVAKAFHDELYADQPSESGPFPDDDWLVAKAVKAGATEADVRPGIEGMTQQEWVDAATKAATDAGVASTPTILVDDKPFTAEGSVDDLAAALLAAVG